MGACEHPTALVLYHYLYPDDVVSAILFSELSAGLVQTGWHVTASSSNRAWHNDRETYPRRSTWNGVEFRRVWRPRLRQASALGRVANAIWMISAWSLLALNRRVNPQVLIVGTDPILSPVVSIVWKFLRPDVRLVHWCFDLYPEAAIADGVLAEKSLAARLFQWLMQRSYRSFDLIVDIGSCMRNRLLRYGSEATHATIVPWALSEPDSPAPIPASERSKLFGNAKLGLLYAGSIGRAHTWRGILELAKTLCPTDGRVIFSVRGNAVDQLRRAVDESNAPVGFTDFVSPRGEHAERLPAMLSAADVHIVTLRDEWTGTVVPSKFFGALAMGRPVLFAGSADSAIYKWVKELGVGWILDPERVESLAIELTRWSECPQAKERLFQHCHSVYQREFSRAQALERWNCVLRSLVGD